MSQPPCKPTYHLAFRATACQSQGRESGWELIPQFRLDQIKGQMRVSPGNLERYKERVDSLASMAPPRKQFALVRLCGDEVKVLYMNTGFDPILKFHGSRS